MRYLTVAVAGLLLAGFGCEQSNAPESTAPAAEDATSIAAGDASTDPSPSSNAAPRQPASGDVMTSQSPPNEPAAATIELRNRLGEETSPYLLQHQHNPVHWFAWGPEAFEAARILDRPIFLSIGYSTCYWCHVMERESFENEAVAAIMNANFICIKVDREERPDVDDIYMAATQAFNQGRGGWPMSVFLEPEQLRPFFAGTYFPPEDRDGRLGFPTVLQQVAGWWRDRRSDVVGQAEQAARNVAMQLSVAGQPQPVGRDQVERGAALLLSRYDNQDAGFGGAPKFPMPVTLDFLMVAAWDLKPYRDALIHTLDRMATGGMYDQVGGGFHRYSTDARWLVPHFEKMLYDNGQLASTYAAAYERTSDAFYAEIVRETLDFVIREMTDDAGGFFSAQDAEVNAREGENYVWTDDQVREALADAGLSDDIDFALEVYGFTRGPNFQDPHHPEDGRKNVVFLIDTPAAIATSKGMPAEDVTERLARINAAMLAVRDRRDQPGTDDKVLAGWNGLMIAGLADGGRVLNEPAYTAAAARAADFVLREMRDAEGGLLRSYRAGRARIPAFLEDYAFFVKGLLALHRTTGESRWLQDAAALAEAAKQRFWDPAGGAYFDTRADQSDLFVRTKSLYDGAVPCGNSVMLVNLLGLNTRTGESAWLDDAAATLAALSPVLAARPTGAVVGLIGLQRMVDEHPDRVDAPFAARPGQSPVRITTSASTVQVARDRPGEVEVTLRLATGHHVNSNRPGIDYLIPLKIELVGGEGLSIDVRYPPGEAYDGPEGRMLVHHDRVTLPVRISQTGPVSAAGKLLITYQVCTDKVCLQPVTEPLRVRIEAE
ncbi:MAG: DUF255 domain-containing protein [Planctomycetota bacterium]|jgi:uncharacterized protein YyaL (SSP411 family)